MPPKRLLGTFALLTAVSPVQAALLPTEIYYNGPVAGADPDEFLELTNSGDSPLALKGFRFGAGLGLDFTDLRLAPGGALIVAPNPRGFSYRFTDFTGTVLDASGSLSNAGETLTLLDAGGAPVFSFTYDDSGAWPPGADGDGASLQLLAGAIDLADPASWKAGVPTPGTWIGSPVTGAGGSSAGTVPGPASLWLLSSGLLLLRVRRHRGGVQNPAPHHILESH